MGALARAFFNGANTEYRETHRWGDIEQAKVVVSIVTIMVAAFISVDYYFFGLNRLFYTSLWARGIFCVISILVFISMKKNTKIIYTDYALLFWSVFLAALTLGVNITRPSDFNDNILLHGVMILGSYTLIPNRMLFKAIPALMFTVADLIILFFSKTGVSPAALIIWTTTFITINIIGLTTSIRMEYYRRKQHEAKILDNRNRQQLVELASTDSLTAIFNRRHFIELGEIEFDRYNRFGHTFSFVVIDIDKFKSINDTFGHPTGDLVLQSFCEILNREKRSIDIIGRLGGDEFGMIMPETSARDAAKAIHRIKHACKTLVIKVSDDIFHITISTGVAEARTSDRSMDDLYRRADKHLYKTRQSSRKC